MAKVPTLTPFQPPLGPQPHGKFYSPHEVVLALKEKVFSLSGDDFTVRTAEGQDVLKVKGKWISLRSSKKFTDMAENEIFTLSNKLMSIHKSFYAEAPGAAHNFEVSGKFKLMGSKSVVTFKNASDAKDIELDVKGDWFDRSAEISLDGRLVAKISRKFFNAREFFGDKQTYFVAVAPNVDLSLIAAVCISLDEKENDSG